MKFEITGPTFSTNERLGRDWRARAAQIKRLRKQYGWQIIAGLQDAGTPLAAIPDDPPDVKMHVKITLYRGRRFDPDNVRGGSVKILLDAMRDCRLLKNDSPRWLELEVEQKLEKDKNRERTEVEMAPADNPTGGAQ